MLSERIEDLSPAKRELFSLLLEERDLETVLEQGDLEAALLEADQEYVAPRTPVEEELAAVWAEVLGLDRVGVTDSFFDLGGDSILSIRIVAKANRLGMPLTSKHLFERPTVAELAILVEQLPPAEAQPAAEPGPDLTGLTAQQLTPEHFPEAELTEDDLRQVLDFVARPRSRRAAEVGGAGSPAGPDEAAARRVTDELPRFQELHAARY